MQITVTCPRCKQSMTTHSRVAGSYAICAHCNGRFWIPEDAAHDASQPAEPTDPAKPDRRRHRRRAPNALPRAAPPAAASRKTVAGLLHKPIVPIPQPTGGSADRPPQRAPVEPQAEPSPPGAVTPFRAAPGAAGPPATPARQAAPAANEPGLPVAVPAKRVARFITADAAQSTLRLAEDGRLPELRLQESGQGKAKPQKGLTVNPLVMLGLLCLSVTASVVLVLIEPAPSGSADSSGKAAARQVIARHYFSDAESSRPDKPYQLLLREAQMAYARGDYRKERELYQRVLDLLRQERGPFEGLTGSASRDRELEKHILVLLSDH
jgi:hypothetical protein